jgi:hypothetical protein
MIPKIKNEIDLIKRSHKQKLDEIHKLLALDFEPESLLKSSDTGKDYAKCRAHKETVEKVEQLNR